MEDKIISGCALRSWKNTGPVLYDLHSGRMKRLRLLEFMELRAREDKMEEIQRYRSYPNEYFPIAQWAVTNRCNYKCRHCFMMPGKENAADEPSYEQCMELIEQFAACGIPEIYLTGGEPLLRNDFLSIIDRLIEKNICIRLISTNGSFVTGDLLREIRDRGINPAFVVSFDGIGCHDWMRGVKGAEGAALRAIRLVREYGFDVICEVAVHKGNAGVLLETARLMHELDVTLFKTIRVAESPRWRLSSEDNSMPVEEYYDAVLEVLDACVKEQWQMDMKLIGFVYYYHATKGVDILPAKGCALDNDGTVLCRKARSIVFVSGDGRVLPCNPFAGITAGKEDWGNAFETPLQSLLTESEYLNKVNSTVGMLKEHNEKCRKCKWLKECVGGCRVLAYGYTGDYLGTDETKCAFFEGGYSEKIRRVVP